MWSTVTVWYQQLVMSYIQMKNPCHCIYKQGKKYVFSFLSKRKNYNYRQQSQNQVFRNPSSLIQSNLYHRGMIKRAVDSASIRPSAASVIVAIMCRFRPLVSASLAWTITVVPACTTSLCRIQMGVSSISDRISNNKINAQNQFAKPVINIEISGHTGSNFGSNRYPTKTVVKSHCNHSFLHLP